MRTLHDLNPDVELPDDICLPPSLGFIERIKKYQQLLTYIPNPELLMRQQREREVAEKKRKAEWLDENIVNPAPLIKKWGTQAVNYRDALTDFAIEIFPMTDGLEQANSTLKYSLDMERAEIDSNEFLPFVRSLARIRLFERIVPMVIKNESYRRQIIERKIAREFPVHDGDHHVRSQNEAGAPSSGNANEKAPATNRVSRNPFREDRDSFGRPRRPTNVQRRRVPRTGTDGDA